MQVREQTWTVTRSGFWSPEILIEGAAGGEMRLRDGVLVAKGRGVCTIGTRGACRRGHTLRDVRGGRLVAAALPLEGCRTGYSVAVRGGDRLVLERVPDGFWSSAIVATRRGEEVLRFGSPGFWSGETLAEQRAPLAPEVVAFLAFLRKQILDAEAAAVAAAASA
jgi:hypothetical protein